jgi:hypothetical protein
LIYCALSDKITKGYFIAAAKSLLFSAYRAEKGFRLVCECPSKRKNRAKNGQIPDSEQGVSISKPDTPDTIHARKSLAGGRELTQTKQPSAEILLRELQSIPQELERLASSGKPEPILALRSRQQILPYQIAVALSRETGAVETLAADAVELTNRAAHTVRQDIARYERLLQEAKEALPALESRHQDALNIAKEYRELSGRIAALVIETATLPQPEHTDALGYITQRSPELRASITAILEMAQET